MKGILIEPHYFPNIQYFSFLASAQQLVIDDVSVFIKQSYRNRTRILTTNKPMDLIVPVKKGKTRLPMKEVKIDYSTKWQREQLHAIQSAYGKSPFYEFYFDYFSHVFTKTPVYLLDLNLEIIEILIPLINMGIDIRLLSGENYQTEPEDLRNLIHPKTGNTAIAGRQKEYHQVFQEKFGFVPGLSVIDLLFNQGNESEIYLTG